MGHVETSVAALVEIGKSGVSRPMLLKRKGKDTGTLIVVDAEIVGADYPPVTTQQYAPPTAQMANASIISD